MKTHPLTFPDLATAISRIHHELSNQASRAVNISFTLRNWMIGYYIEEYERSGSDRAEYGERLMDQLAKTLTGEGLPRCERRELYRYRKFYITYPKIGSSLPPQFSGFIEIPDDIEVNEIVATLLPQLHPEGSVLITRLSFSHFMEFIDIEDETKRAFYEVECIRGNWSVRELKRQIHSLYYERSGLSIDKNALSVMAHDTAEKIAPGLNIRDPYIFEFLGLKPCEVMGESHLEDQLLDKLQEFLLELGHGFCFEGRQKRILIGDSHYFVDLVFYHRILKCHVLVELKLEPFNHENIGQLNTYVSWYRANMMTEGDNPPVGILLCTHKEKALVEYALAGMDNNLFVSRYLLELPKKEEMQRFIEGQIRAGM